MKYNKVNLVYFSATDTTKRIVEHIAQGIHAIDKITEYNITQGQEKDICFRNDDIVIFGFPVYAGRIPQLSVQYLNKLKGSNTPAIIVCVYGNREYDDALLELRDVVVSNNFSVISAGAFIAQHSIFPEVAKNRPDADDYVKAVDFGRESFDLLNRIEDVKSLNEIEVKGNYPYKELVSSPPLIPTIDEGKCNECGRCAMLCPTNAIDKHNLKKTNELLCISCGRCIYECSRKARRFDGEAYRAKAAMFTQMFSARKEVETLFVV